MRRIERQMMVAKVPNPQKKRTSNKSKLKQSKPKPNSKYSTSKPMKSKAVSQFRNNSNI